MTPSPESMEKARAIALEQREGECAHTLAEGGEGHCVDCEHLPIALALEAVQRETRREAAEEMNAKLREHPVIQALAIARQALGGEPAPMTVNGEPAVGIILPAYALEVVDRTLRAFPLVPAPVAEEE